MFCFVFKLISNGKYMIRIIVKLVEMSYMVIDILFLIMVWSLFIVYIYIVFFVILVVIYDDVIFSVVDVNIVMENMVYLY